MRCQVPTGTGAATGAPRVAMRQLGDGNALTRPRSILGLLIQMGGGVRDYQQTGQLNVFLNYDLHSFLKFFDRVYLFSYFEESLSEYTKDPILLSRVVVLPKPQGSRLPHKFYGVLLPWIYHRQLADCSVIRVLQATGSLPAILARLLWGVPYVPSFGYRYAEFARIEASRLKAITVPFLERVAARWADAIIVTTEPMASHVRHLAPSASIVMLPNGIDTRVFSPSNDRSGQRRPDHPREILFVGRLEEQKNLLVLIEALGLLQSRIPVRLTLVGDGSLRAEVARHAEAKKVAVAFAGVVPNRDLPDYYRRAEVFALPSLAEGHPKALLEAMSQAFRAWCRAARATARLLRTRSRGSCTTLMIPSVWPRRSSGSCRTTGLPWRWVHARTSTSSRATTLLLWARPRRAFSRRSAGVGPPP